MKDILVHILSEGIAGDLKENPIAYKLLDVVLKGVSQKDFEQRLKSTVSTTEIKEEDRKRVVTNSVSFRDLRIKDIGLRGIRSFPLPKDNKWYYCDFTRGGVPASCVFLGNNGVGKTSLFCALEATATGTSSVAKERGYDNASDSTGNNDPKTLLSFLTYYDTERKEVKAWQRFKEGMAIFENENFNGTEVTPAFFCSHWDIMQLSAEGKLKVYLMDQLGIRTFYDIVKYFQDNKSKFDEYRFEYFSNRPVLDKIKTKEFKSEDLRQYEKDLIVKLEKIERESILFNLNHLELGFFLDVFNFLKFELIKILKKSADSLESIIGGILTPYFNREINDIKVKVDEKNLNFNIEIHTRDINHNLVQPKTMNQGKKGEWSVAPQKFLNTFRFKLFCVGLKVALAELVSELYLVNYPMVIDDVFDSSDFDNRLKIYDFTFDLLTAVKEIRRKRINEKKDGNLRDNNIGFQLIFFTQDEIIGDSVYKALRDFEGKDRVKYGRLFHWRECTEEDIVGKEFIKVYDSLI